MLQIYCSNVKANVDNREQIKKCSTFSNEEWLIFNVPSQTVSKWKNSVVHQDALYCLLHIEYVLSALETALIISISCSWLPLDEIYETLLEQNPTV